MRMPGFFLICITLFSIILSSNLFPQNKEFSYNQDIFQNGEFYEKGWDFKIDGYYKNLFMYQQRETFYKNISSPPEEKRMVSDLNRFRISPEINYSESFTLHTDIDFEAIKTNYRNTSEFNAYWEESEYNDFVKPSWEPVDNSDIYCRLKFQNIYAKMVAGNFTGTAGRQQIRFGSSRLWNPLDLMNPLSPLSVEGSGQQKGADAVRIDWYPGESTELTGVVNPRKEYDSYDRIGAKSGNYIARLKSGVKEFDAAILTGNTAKRKNFGTDFAAVINDGLLTGVFLYSKPENGKAYYQCGSGYEYTFASGLYLLMEYFYNGSPVNEDDNLRAALYHFSIEGIDQSNYYYLSNRIITYNCHYLSIAAGYDFSPLLRGELFSIYDFQGRGLFLNGSLKFNAMENLDLLAGVITALVDQNDRISDFIIYDGQPMLYASLQFYF